MAGRDKRTRRTATAARRRSGRNVGPVNPDAKHLTTLLRREGFGGTLETDPETGEVIARFGRQDSRRPATRRAGAAAAAYGRRRRRQLAPALPMTGLWTAGMVMHACANGPVIGPVIDLAAIPLVLGIAGGLAGWKLLHSRITRIYLAACLLVAWMTLWQLAAHGSFGRAAGWSFAAWCAAALPWWWRHRGSEILPDPDPGPVMNTEAEETWDKYAACAGGPLPKSRLVNRQATANGWTAIIVLERGKQTVAQAIAASDRIASALGVSAENLALERMPDGREHLVKLTFLEKNPLHQINYWGGPTLDPETGSFTLGPYASGGEDARFRLWAPAGGGHAAGALHALISGATGSGKSQFLLTLLIECWLSEMVTTWYIDPQGGQSGPEIVPLVDWAATDCEQAIDMLRAAERVMTARSRYMGQVLKQRNFVPAKDFPLLSIVIDEAHVLLKHPEYKAEAVPIIERLCQMGRKCGISIILVTQVPLLDQLGNSEVIRSQLQAGNVVVFRTAGSMTGQLAFQGLPVRPDRIPSVFANGQGSGGLCYLVSAMSRESAARTLYVKDGERVATEAARYQAPLDRVSAAAAGQVYADRPRGGDGMSADDLIAQLSDDGTIQPAPQAPAAPASSGVGPSPAPAANGNGELTPSSVILEVLAAAATPLSNGHVINEAGKITRGRGMDLYPIRVIQETLLELKRTRRIRQDSDGNYFLPQPATPKTGRSSAAAGAAGTPGKAAGLLRNAVELVITTQHGSPSMLQRQLREDVDVARELMRLLEELEVVGPADNPDATRTVLKRAAELDDVLAGLDEKTGAPA